MPHTSRKKIPVRPKRRQIPGEDGWTKVTSSDPDRVELASQALSSEPDKAMQQPVEPYTSLMVTMPDAPPADDMAVEKLRKHYNAVEKRWLGSDSCKALNEVLSSQAIKYAGKIENCVLFGSGSLCGYVLGWINRHEVALVQTAIFKSVVDAIEQVQGSRPEAYAQEITYNTIDKEFLTSIQIAVIDNPAGFALLDKPSFAYAPGAELDVELRTIFRNPLLFLGAKVDMYWRNSKGLACTNRQRFQNGITLEELEQKMDATSQAIAIRARGEAENNCQIVEMFQGHRQDIMLPDLDMKDFPFYQTHLYWPVANVEEVKEEVDGKAIEAASENVIENAIGEPDKDFQLPAEEDTRGEAKEYVKKEASTD